MLEYIRIILKKSCLQDMFSTSLQFFLTRRDEKQPWGNLVRQRCTASWWDFHGIMVGANRFLQILQDVPADVPCLPVAPNAPEPHRSTARLVPVWCPLASCKLHGFMLGQFIMAWTMNAFLTPVMPCVWGRKFSHPNMKHPFRNPMVRVRIS
jgi:hypothetical protein